MCHVSHQGQQFGPYTVEQINQYLAQGAFDAGSHVWDANANGWVPLWQLPGVILPAVDGATLKPIAPGHSSTNTPSRVGKKNKIKYLAILCGVALIAVVLVIQKDKKEGQEDAQAQYNLAIKYYDGDGVEQDFKEAVKWFQKAADQGFALAQYNLGVMYEKGQGVGQDFKEAVKWYQKAADQGIADAQNNLGFMYANGQGLEKNYATAYAWVSIAAANGLEIAKEATSIIAKEMTPAQIAEAEELVKEMVEKNPKLLNK